MSWRDNRTPGWHIRKYQLTHLSIVLHSKHFFICSTFNFVYFIGWAIHKLKISTKYLKCSDFSFFLKLKIHKLSKALRKSPLSEKVVYEYFDTYDIFLLRMSMKDTQNCIKTSWNALILLRIRPRINYFHLLIASKEFCKQCIQMS